MTLFDRTQGPVRSSNPVQQSPGAVLASAGDGARAGEVAAAPRWRPAQGSFGHRRVRVGRRVRGCGYRRRRMPEWNQRVIDEFRANGGRVGGPYEGRTLLLL